MNKKIYLIQIFLYTILFVLLSGCVAETDIQSERKEYDDHSTFYHSKGIDENGFWEDITALDYVDISKYTALSIPSNIHQVSDTTIQDEIANILAYYSTNTQIYNRPAIDGDIVNIDYIVSINDVKIEDASTNNQGTYVTIGEPEYIDGFLKQLIGLMPGETIRMDVTFPEDYVDENLQGENAVFFTTINYIIEREDIELTDDFVIENLFVEYGWSTISEMIEGLRRRSQKQLNIDYVENYLSGETLTQNMPDKLIEYQKRAFVEEYRYFAEDNNMELAEYLDEQGISNIDELLEINKEHFWAMATYSLVAQAVAEKVGITVSDDDLSDFFVTYFSFTDYSLFQEIYDLPFLKQIALYKKVVEYIAENAVLA